MNLRRLFKSLSSYPAEQEETTPSSTSSLEILVTGASSGFGELIAKTLAKAGHRVHASMRGPCDRNLTAASRLRTWAQAESVALNVVELDVTDQDSVARAIASIEGMIGHLDVVINNAGTGGMGIVEAFSIDQMQAMFDVNTLGAMRVIKAVLPAMRRRKSGFIVYISSTAGRIVIPEGNPYIATKFATEALAESLYHQLAPFGIDVTILEPGYYPTTSFVEKKTPPADGQIAAEYAAAAPDVRPRRTSSGGVGPVSADPQEVADAVRHLIELPKQKKPLRMVVGKVASAGVNELNHAYAKYKRQMLDSLGISA
jgi:NADP-dependent 3-hydroxy acid dehydrogenase YdfG